MTVLIGIAVDGKALGGVVHQPFWGHGQGQGHGRVGGGVGRSVWAVRGCGMGQECGSDTDPARLLGSVFRPTPPPPNKTIVVTSRSRRSALVETAVKSLKPDEVLYAGGCGNKVCNCNSISKKSIQTAFKELLCGFFVPFF